MMTDSKVETISRLAQWKIETWGPCSYRRSDPFKVGLWNWHLSIEKSRYLYIRLFPEPSRVVKEQPPFVKFVIRISNIGGSACSIWPNDGAIQSNSSKSTLRCLSRMLDEAIHTDITINTSNGTVRAHKAILSASSPVFASMFLHDLKEKESSTINIEDMSVESCTVLLSYLYGGIRHEDFWKHRLALLNAADKYDMGDLKELCEESLLEDIDSSNVLERLREAWLYQLVKLKKGCLIYLFDFGKIYDVRDEIDSFFRHVDRELMVDMFQELLNAGRVG
ncbi:hypothetical protein AMTRI_Chr11g98650 [Amborella trichopoda]